jgi:heptosyltransferase-2
MEKTPLSFASIFTSPVFEKPTDLVWIQTSFIGDIVLNTAALALAAEALPGVRQHLITTSVGVRVLSGCRHVSSLTVFDKKSRSSLSAMLEVRSRLVQVLNEERAQRHRVITLLPHRSIRSALLSKFLPWKSIGYLDAPASALYNVRVPRVATMHESARIGLLLEPLGVGREKIAAASPNLEKRVLPDVSTMPSWYEALAKWKGPSSVSRRVIAVAPGSKWGTKRWTAAGFTGLLEKLLKVEDFLVVLIGSSEEASLCKALEDAVMARLGTTSSHARLVNIAGVTGLDELRTLYPMFDLLVSNDSSPVHYASAFRVPTVAIFGATVPSMGFGPLAPGSSSVGISLECRPCSDHGPQECPLGHFRCMKDLSVDQVISACESVLQRTIRNATT